MNNLISCKLIIKFDDKFTEIIETNYFYNTDIINKMFIILFQEYISLLMFVISNS